MSRYATVINHARKLSRLVTFVPSKIARPSSVASGGRGSSLFRWPEKNATYHVFSAFDADFCSKNENSPPSTGIGDQKLWKTCCDMDQKTGVFFWTSPKVGQKSWLNLGENLFFGDHVILDENNDSIWSKIDQNLGQDRLMFFPVTKTVYPNANSWLRDWLDLTKSIQEQCEKKVNTPNGNE